MLQLARNEKEGASQRAALEALALPPGFAQYVTSEAASKHAGVPVAAGGLWFPEGGWIQPRSLVDALLESCGDRLKRVFSENVSSLKNHEITILATADDALHPVPHTRLRRVRGQVTHVPAGLIDAPHVVVLRGGFVLPPVEGVCVIGASFDIDDDDPAVRASSHEGNLERMSQIFCLQPDLSSNTLEGRVGFRLVAPDRLPLVGKLGENLYGALAFGSRGLVWSSLAAEIIASELEGEPLPVEGALADALDPWRFEKRATRRAGYPGSRP